MKMEKKKGGLKPKVKKVGCTTSSQLEDKTISRCTTRRRCHSHHYQTHQTHRPLVVVAKPAVLQQLILLLLLLLPRSPQPA
jgi:hypothetical protein